jgi:hypothetical protein
MKRFIGLSYENSVFRINTNRRLDIEFIDIDILCYVEEYILTYDSGWVDNISDYIYKNNCEIL